MGAHLLSWRRPQLNANRMGWLTPLNSLWLLNLPLFRCWGVRGQSPARRQSDCSQRGMEEGSGLDWTWAPGPADSCSRAGLGPWGPERSLLLQEGGIHSPAPGSAPGRWIDCFSPAVPFGKGSTCAFALITLLGGNLSLSRGDLNIRGSWVTYHWFGLRKKISSQENNKTTWKKCWN